MNTAILSSFDKYTTFSFGGKTLTFWTCNCLERYTKVLQWDDGYIEVMVKYKHKDEESEEYIDLIPVLEGLYMDKEKFLAPIKEVKIEYAWKGTSENCRKRKNHRKWIRFFKTRWWIYKHLKSWSSWLCNGN